MTKEQLLEAGEHLRGRYARLQEINSLTDQAIEAFGRNDTDAAALALDMRGEQMEQADECMERLHDLMQTLDQQDVSALKRLMHAGDLSEESLYSGFSQEERDAAVKVAAISIRSREVLRDTIRKDEAMNRKITGKHTFYQGKD